jgi:hypothetical protein
MTTYRMKVGKNMTTTVHSVTCNVVVNRSRKEGVWEVEAESAKQAAAQWDEHNDTVARQIPVTKVCPCCNE